MSNEKTIGFFILENKIWIWESKFFLSLYTYYRSCFLFCFPQSSLNRNFGNFSWDVNVCLILFNNTVLQIPRACPTASDPFRISELNVHWSIITETWGLWCIYIYIERWEAHRWIYCVLLVQLIILIEARTEWGSLCTVMDIIDIICLLTD